MSINDEKNKINKVTKINKKRYYISVVAGILAVLSLTYTVKEIQKAGDKLASINKAKNSLEQSTDTKINNEISSNYVLNDIENNINKQDIDKKSKNNYTNNNIEDSNKDKNIDKENNNTDSNEKKEEKTTETLAINDVNKSISKLTFSEELGLLWPIQGDILKNYSIEKLVYFPTLGVFKSNPAVFISAKEGDKVKAAHKGIVTEVGQDKELGKYVEMAIGNNYTLLYGQLSDIQVVKGDKVEEGDTIAYIATPSPFYTKEGSHLYFKVTQNNNSIDPMLLLR